MARGRIWKWKIDWYTGPCRFHTPWAMCVPAALVMSARVVRCMWQKHSRKRHRSLEVVLGSRLVKAVNMCWSFWRWRGGHQPPLIEIPNSMQDLCMLVIQVGVMPSNQTSIVTSRFWPWPYSNCDVRREVLKA